MKYILYAALLLASGAFAQTPKIDALIRKMTLEEKVGQMTQIAIDALYRENSHEIDPAKLALCIRKYKVGSILNGYTDVKEAWRAKVTQIQEVAGETRLRIPVLYGVDAVRGNNYTLQTVLFPVPIAQAATFDPQLIKRMAAVTAYETRADYIPWTFSPVLDLGRMPQWPRVWETYGEDPLLDSQMGVATMTGYQGEGKTIDKYHVAACLKHFMGYSMPLSGHDRTPAWIPERELREYFLPPFAAAVKAGARSVMVNSAEINGVPVHANRHILTDILKTELGFRGIVLSDWQDIEYLYQRHRVARDNKDAVRIAVNAGIDMSMVPMDYTFCDDLVALVKEGKVPLSRINDAVRRILRVKYELGLFEQPLGEATDYPDVNSAAHNRINSQIAAESITLLKNTHELLPLKPGQRLLVTGPAASTMRALNGGWSRGWDGKGNDELDQDKNTILEAMQQANPSGQVSYAAGCGFEQAGDINDALIKAKAADVIVLCLGETSYAETPGNINDMNLPEPQVALAKALAATGKPIVLVLTEGRPRIVSAIEPLCAAVLDAYIPGNDGGNAIAAVLDGRINPSGRLPFTYPRYSNALLNYYHKYTETGDADPGHGFDPQWEFGFGLSYTSFKYSNLQLSSAHLSGDRSVSLSVEVTNTGQREGKETVQLYISQQVASITPEVKRLRDFDKISLGAGETRKMTFRITKSMLAFVNHELRTVSEPGAFKLSVGGLTADLTLEERTPAYGK